jgi:3-hydroxyisobutyrate dehydrogenase-like beta-hydroxyacid dehydrogenase
MTTIGLLHPGAMGAELGRQLVAAGHQVRWVTDGRSAATRDRADRARLTPCDSLPALVMASDVVVSVCPPASALDVARSVAAAGFRGLYLDANAIAPETAQVIATSVTDGGGGFVDGGIVGSPPARAGTTRLFLAGPLAPVAADLFTGTTVHAVVLGDSVGAASAAKAAYAGWTKASSALLLAVRSYARAWGVEGALLDEWSRSIPDLPERSDEEAARIHRKAWRFDGEMREIESTLRATGLPSGFHHAAAEVFARLASLKDDPADQDPGAVLDRLRGSAS